MLKDHMGFLNEIKLTIMCERQKGLITTIDWLFLEANFKYCARHIYEKFRKKFSAEIFKEKFWKASKSTNHIDFDVVMDATKNEDEAAHKWLMDNSPTL